MTGEPSGSTAMARIDGFRLVMTSPTPVMVPPVPTAETRTSAAPEAPSHQRLVRRRKDGETPFAHEQDQEGPAQG